MAVGVAACRAASLCFGLLPLGVEFGEPVADAGAHGGGGRAVGDVFQRPDLRVLLGVQFLDGGAQRGGFGVAAGGGLGVGGGSWAARNSARPGPKMRSKKNFAAIASSRCSGACTVRGWSGAAARWRGLPAGAGTGSRRRRGRGRWRCRSSAAGRSCTAPATGTGSTARSAGRRRPGRGWWRARRRCAGRRARWPGR